MNARFDAYTATVSGIDRGQAFAILRPHILPGDQWREGDGYHGFGRKESFKGGDGAEWASMLYGGRQGDRVMVEVKGERTPDVVQAIREVIPSHRCTRVDSCADFNAPGAWEKLLQETLEVKAAFKLRGERRGDWDFPEDGRTQYLGAPSSPVRARLYEKGKQPEYRHLAQFDLVRAEVQVRPKNAAREVYATLGPLDVWGASPFVRDLAARVLHAQVKPQPAGTIYRETDRDRSLRWMCKQYGPHLVSLHEDLGDWECVGRTLMEYIAQERAARIRKFKG